MGQLQIEHWFFAFFLFTLIGWVQESTIESIYHHKLINRGFLKGPYIPIYGVGGCLMLLCCLPFRSNGFVVFFIGMLSCTTLEYFTGWLMEKVFHKQFWDYSMFRITYKNRISLISSLFWGVLSLFMVYVLYGLVSAVCGFLPFPVIVIFDVAMTVAMLTDSIFTIRENLNKKALERKNEPELQGEAEHEK